MMEILMAHDGCPFCYALASNHFTGPSSNADARDIMLKVIGKCPCCATLGAVTLHILGDVCNQDALQWLLRLGSCATDPSVEA